MGDGLVVSFEREKKMKLFYRFESAPQNNNNKKKPP